MIHRERIAVVALAGWVSLAGCAHLGGQEVEAFTNPSVPGHEFAELGLVAGDASSPGRAIANRVRARLEETGYTVLRNPGTWETQEGALVELCMANEPPATGVLFVWWNRIVLRACRPGYPRAFEVRSAYVDGVDDMLERLLEYLAGQEQTDS